jgi:hypothetical protein
MSGKVELPIVTETETDKKHVSLLLIADGLRQAETNLSEQEANIKKFSDQLSQLQGMRIASMAQKNLLEELQKRIIELEDKQ